MMNMSDELESESAAKEKTSESVLIDSPRYISDTITVTAIPEKRGVFLKHTEYEITSEKFKSKVDRRYSDFSTLYSYLQQKYPNRMIPRPPPKQIMMDSFIEERRCGLQRWLRLLSHHPIIASDDLLKVFLTVTTGDHLVQMLISFNNETDEYCQLPPDAKVPHVDLDQMMSSRELMRTRLNQVVRLKKIMEHQAKRDVNQAQDFEELARTVNAISTDSSYKNFAEKFSEIAKESENMAKNQQLAVTERLFMIMDVLTAHSDLCERVERNLDVDQNRRSLGEAYEKEIKRRKSFALFCVAEETKFAQKYLKLLPSILLQFSFEESKGSSKIAESFKKIVDFESDKINCEDERQSSIE